jgi:dTDP-4-dehydrorhamnose reductase
VTPITTAEYPTAAVRPANSVLDGGRLAREWNVVLPDWQAAFDHCLPLRAHG